MGGNTANIYELRPVSIVRTLPQINDHRLFQLKLEDGTTWESFGHRPGQFIEVSIFGKGEAPISISSPSTRLDTLEICVRRSGKVTNALFEMGKGSTFHIRGPYGRGFPVEELKPLSKKGSTSAPGPSPAITTESTRIRLILKKAFLSAAGQKSSRLCGWVKMPMSLPDRQSQMMCRQDRLQSPAPVR